MQVKFININNTPIYDYCKSAFCLSPDIPTTKIKNFTNPNITDMSIVWTIYTAIPESQVDNPNNNIRDGRY